LHRNKGKLEMRIKNIDLVAKTLHGLEEVLAEELKALGAEEVTQGVRAVSFKGDLKMIYEANLHLRTAIKILQPVHTFRTINQVDFYTGIRNIDWSQYMTNDDTLSIDGVVSSPHFNHSGFIALKAKDAIVDQFRDKTGKRPSVSTSDPTIRINIHINDDRCTVSLDTSGEALNKRGYRVNTNQAPINEVLAAGMILLSGWDKKTPFVDPMCGSGTMLIEAAMIAKNIPPNIIRQHFGFETWNNFNQDLWEEVLDEAYNKYIDDCPPIIGSDIDKKIINAAKVNINNIRLTKCIKLESLPVEQFVPPTGPGIVVTNPPYGERLKKSDIDNFYKTIGDRMKSVYKDYDVWLLSSNLEAIKFIGLRPTRRIHLLNGPLDCRFLKFSIYEGSKKAKYQENYEPKPIEKVERKVKTIKLKTKK
jgi:putative N6-adenine-specific DNA methylase